MSDERRGGRRIPTKLEISLRNLGTNRRSLQQKTRDISAGGLFIETDVVLPVGELVEVDFGTDDVQVSLTARVARAEAGGLGLRFVDVVPQALFRLALLLRQLEDETEV